MRTRLINAGLLLFAASFCVVPLTGCRTAPAQGQSLYSAKFSASGSKIPLRIALRLPDWAPAGTHHQVVDFGNVDPRLVPPVILSVDCVAIARAVFAEVQVQHSAASPPTDAQVQAVLMPEVRRVDMVSLGTDGWWPKQIVALSVVWTLTDLKGEVVWVDTIKAEARSPRGNALHMKKFARRRVETVVDTFAQRSYDCLCFSSAIKNYATAAPQ